MRIATQKNAMPPNMPSDPAAGGGAQPEAVPVETGAPLRYAYACALSLPPATGGRWTACAPDLEGCRSEGDGARECIANITDAVEAWVTAAQGRGDALPPPNAMDSLARLPEHAKALWLLIVRRDRPDDLEVSKALAEAGTLPSMQSLPVELQPASATLPDSTGVASHAGLPQPGSSPSRRPP